MCTEDERGDYKTIRKHMQSKQKKKTEKRSPIINGREIQFHARRQERAGVQICRKILDDWVEGNIFCFKIAYSICEICATLGFFIAKPRELSLGSTNRRPCRCWCWRWRRQTCRVRLGPNEGIEIKILGAIARKGLVAVAASKSLGGHM